MPLFLETPIYFQPSKKDVLRWKKMAFWMGWNTEQKNPGFFLTDVETRSVWNFWGNFETTSIFFRRFVPQNIVGSPELTSTVWKGIHILRAYMCWVSMLIFGGVHFVLDDPNSGWNKYQLFQIYSSRSFRRTWNYPNNSGQKMEWWELS